MIVGTQDRYIIQNEQTKKVAVSLTGTIHLSDLQDWEDVKVFKEYNTAKKCIEKNEKVLTGCKPVRCRISYEVSK